MSLGELCIRRPVATTLVMAALCVFGGMAYRLLPVSDLPNVDFPTISVTAALPGASPETMASAVATTLEREFSTIAAIDSMTSSSLQGSTQITLQFALERDIDAAAQDVQAAIARAAKRLPPEMPTPPSYQKVNPADQPIIYLSVTSPTLPLSTIDRYAEIQMSQRLSTLAGVAQVQVFGAQKHAVRIQLDPRELAHRGLGLDEVADAAAHLNVDLPTGLMQGAQRALTVESNGQLMDADAWRDGIVAWRGGSPVRLSDLGQVIDSVENDKTAAWFNGQRGVILAVQRQPGANTVEVAAAVRALLPAFERELPASLSVGLLYDRSEGIRASVDDVRFTLVLTLVLVVLVIFLFLRNLRATAIPSLAMPLSIVGTFAVMYLLGFSLDNMSLMALTLSVGFVVDDAIVVLENIVRHMELGRTPREAAIEGSREIGFTIISMTLSLVAVFVPVLFMAGVIGRLLNEFAVTIAVAILISGFVSLTLTPMLGSRFLVPERKAQHGALFRATERAWDAALGVYDRTLSWTLRRPAITLVFSALVLAGTVWLFGQVPKGFLPNEDTGRILVQTEAAEGTSFPGMVRYQQAAAAVIAADPDVDSFMSSIGARGGNAAAVNTGTLFIRLKPRDQRALSVDDKIQELRPKLAALEGLRCYPQNLPPIRIGGQTSRSQYQVTLRAGDLDVLRAEAPAMAERVAALPGVQDVSTDLQIRNPQVRVEVDRDRAASLQVTPEQVETALSLAFGSSQISTIHASDDSYQVILELAPQFQGDVDWLERLHVRSGTGQLLPITAVADIHEDVGPLSVNHSGQLPAVTISFNLAPGHALGTAVDGIDALARKTLPPTVTTSFQGAAQVFQSSLQGLGLLLFAAVLVMYIILGVLYESFIHPLTILSALPFAGFGALATLWLFGVELSLYGFVGVILLVGLVKKNGIMMVDFALQAQAEGLGAREAIHKACLVRFRPIMMTTMAALMGTLPIAVGFGAGSESRRPLGLAVVGGLVFSQVVTLYVTPVFYELADGLQRRIQRRRAPAVAPEVASAAAG
ncbi:MAG TPA: efflux RND transporter permease subunit [Planctomycetota bacterium]|nr:efflux RND transporter permease subunit [Planctomycetota bacterium]